MTASIAGPRFQIDTAIPVGVDGSTVLRFQLEDGMQAQEVIALAASAIGAVNEELNQRYGGLWYLTERIFARDRQGETSRGMTGRKAEGAQPDGVRTDKIGHMFPRYDFADATSWSRDYLERANREDVRDDTRLIAERWRNRVDFDFITRLLSIAENQIGGTSGAGYDVPWAIGTGKNVNYIPPQWMGYIFDTTHTHFKFINGAFNATNAAAMLNTLSGEIRHHGHTGRLVALVSDTDVTTYQAMAGFVNLVPFTVVPGVNASTPIQVTQGEVQGVPGELFGYFTSTKGVIELRYHERIPTKYMWVGKSYGINDPRNGLAVRVEPRKGFGLIVSPQVDRSIVPELDKLLFRATHGFAVNDRLNGAAGFIDTGAAAYPEPTIS